MIKSTGQTFSEILTLLRMGFLGAPHGWGWG